MTVAHRKEHEAILAGLALADCTADEEAEVRACEQCRPRISELEVLVERLDDANSAESVLREAALLPEQPSERRVEEALLQVMAHDSPSRRRSAWLLPMALVAAGLLVAIARWWPREEEPRPAVILSGVAIELEQPGDEVSRYDLFAWDAELPAGGSFVLRVFDDRNGEELLRKELFEPRFEPGAELERKLPDTIRWQIDLLSHSLDELGSASRRSRRSR